MRTQAPTMTRTHTDTDKHTPTHIHTHTHTHTNTHIIHRQTRTHITSRRPRHVHPITIRVMSAMSVIYLSLRFNYAFSEYLIHHYKRRNVKNTMINHWAFPCQCVCLMLQNIYFGRYCCFWCFDGNLHLTWTWTFIFMTSSVVVESFVYMLSTWLIYVTGHVLRRHSLD